MKADIQEIIESTGSLPSLPAIATKIVTLAKDPQINMQSVAEVLAKDPAMASKVLRMVNSAMYVTQRQVENLHQAIVIMGLNQTMSMALSFSLISTMKKQQGAALDYEHFWRRMLLSAAAARVVGGHVGEEALEELFLAGLLQDIGMLALDRSRPEFYKDLAATQYVHNDLIAYEKERLGTDHAELGAELLKKWNLADRTCHSVRHSHDPNAFSKGNVQSKFIRSVALAGSIADLFVSKDDDKPVFAVGQLARSYLGLEYGEFQAILESFNALIPEMESLFEMNFVCERDADQIMDQAREILVTQNIETLKQLEKLKQTVKRQDAAAQVYKESGYRDSITGVYNRQYIEQYMQKVLLMARERNKPVSIIFASLNGLENINRTQGHGIGDKALTYAAKVIGSKTPSSSMLARYGGGEFVVVLPGVESATATEVCHALVSEFGAGLQKLSRTVEVTLTLSAAVACQGEGVDYESVDALFAAAESALYQGQKSSGQIQQNSGAR